MGYGLCFRTFLGRARKKSVYFQCLNAECPLLSDLIGDSYKQLYTEHKGSALPGSVLHRQLLTDGDSDVQCYPEFAQLVSVMARFTPPVCLVSKPAPFPLSPCQLAWFTFCSIMVFQLFISPLPLILWPRPLQILLFFPYTSSLCDKKQWGHVGGAGKEKTATESSCFTGLRNDNDNSSSLSPTHVQKKGAGSRLRSSPSFLKAGPEPRWRKSLQYLSPQFWYLSMSTLQI